MIRAGDSSSNKGWRNGREEGPGIRLFCRRLLINPPNIIRFFNFVNLGKLFGTKADVKVIFGWLLLLNNRRAREPEVQSSVINPKVAERPIETGQFFQDHAEFFPPTETVGGVLWRT